MSFKPRFTLPEKGNPFYNTKEAGGYSRAIVGKPTVDGLNTLSNCVGWAYGRYHEIANRPEMDLLAPVNAELFIDYANKSLKVGTEPKLGACLVWQRGATKKGDDGCGHVAIVEQINADGSIVTSESGWNNAKVFWTTKRDNKNGRWGEGSAYKFLGFIYQPEELTPSEIKPDTKPGVAETITLATDHEVYKTAKDATAHTNPVATYEAGEYFIYKVSGQATNITKTAGKAGGWIATADLSAKSKFYPKTTYKGISLVDALKTVNEKSDYETRQKIAQANGVKNYLGLGSQNVQLIKLMQAGKLQRY